jgi:glycosyltransferase involved in cell wall biosynthesis
MTSKFNPDLIISSTPPILTSLSAFMVAKLRGTKFILDVRDIWPDIGIELGLLKNRFVIAALKKIESILIRNAEKITVTAKGDKINLLKKKVDEKKVEVIYNGADTKLFTPKNNEILKQIRNEFNLPIDKKLLIYFGSFNYGMNDIESMEETLKKLPNEEKEIQFIAVGGGALKEGFLNKVSENMHCYSFQNLTNQQIADLVSVCDISLIPRKDLINDTGGNIPVKCFESWAAGVPVLLSAIRNSEIARIFSECNCGRIVEPSNPNDLRKGLISLLSEHDLKEIGEKGREFVLARFDRKCLAEQLVNIVFDVLSL